MLSLFDLIRLADGTEIPRIKRQAPPQGIAPATPTAADPTVSTAPARPTTIIRNNTADPNAVRTGNIHTGPTRSKIVNNAGYHHDQALLSPGDQGSKGDRFGAPDTGEMPKAMNTTKDELSGDRVAQEVFEFIETTPQTFPEGKVFDMLTLATIIGDRLGKLHPRSTPEEKEAYATSLLPTIKVLAGGPLTTAMRFSPTRQIAKLSHPPFEYMGKQDGRMIVKRINSPSSKIELPGGLYNPSKIDQHANAIAQHQNPEEGKYPSDHPRYSNPAKSGGMGTVGRGSGNTEIPSQGGHVIDPGQVGANAQEHGVSALMDRLEQQHSKWQDALQNFHQNGDLLGIEDSYRSIQKTFQALAGDKFDQLDADTQSTVRDIYREIKKEYDEVSQHTKAHANI